ncbi:reductive dehalogenase [Acidobacteriota bacterium]
MERRDFFKLGLTGAGVAAASSLSSGTLRTNSPDMSQNAGHPWWVKSLDKPKLSVDESVYSRFDPKNTVFGSFTRYYGIENVRELSRRNKEMEELQFRERRPGFRLEDRALCDAAWFIHSQGGMNRGTRSWTSNFMRTPEQRGIEKYEGSPEEAARLVKSASRFFGAATTGIAVLDRRHLYSQGQGKPVVFENVEEPQSDKEKHVIPEKCTNAIALTIQMPLDNMQCSPSAIGDAASSIGYSRCEFAVAGLAQFIRGLGYVAIPSVNDLGSSVAIAVDAGLGELARFNRLITPEFGPSVRLAKVITDLPLATDKPIDFGLVEFCKVCMRCSEVCPPQVSFLRCGAQL